MKLPDVGDSIQFADGQVYDCIEADWRTVRFRRPDGSQIQLSAHAMTMSPNYWKLVKRPEPPTRFDRVLAA